MTATLNGYCLYVLDLSTTVAGAQSLIATLLERVTALEQAYNLQRIQIDTMTTTIAGLEETVSRQTAGFSLSQIVDNITLTRVTALERQQRGAPITLFLIFNEMYSCI